MPQPTINQVHIDGPLTNVSIAYRNRQEGGYVAPYVFPRVPVSKQSDLYWIWNKGDWLRGGMKKRAPATESVGGGISLTTGSYRADVWALHFDLADQILANADPGIDLRTAGTEWLQQQAMITREQDWVNNWFTSGKWGTDATGFDKWDDYVLSDPGDQIETAKVAIKSVTGLEPNTLVVGRQVLAKLKFHPLIQDQYKYTSAEAITETLLARYFGVDRLLVAGAIQNTGAEGGADSYSFIAGKHALLCYVTPSPALITPSAGYTFVWSAYGSAGAGVMKSFRMEAKESERLEIQNAWADAIVGSDLGYFWPSVVS